MKRNSYRGRLIGSLVILAFGLPTQITAQTSGQAEADKTYDTLLLSENSIANADEQEELRQQIDELDSKIQALVAEKQQLEIQLNGRYRMIWDSVNSASYLRERADNLDSLAQYSALVQYYDQASEEKDSYWIGVHCISVPTDVRAYLELEEGIGILIEQVIEDSPAEAAQLEERDVIIAVDDSAIGSVEDLVAAIQAKNGNEIVVQVMRRGSELKFDVTPQPRPEQSPEIMGVWNFDPNLQYDTVDLDGVANATTYRWLLTHAQENRQAATLLLDPVQIEYLSAIPLPANMEVTISQSGDNGAMLLIQRDDEKKEVALAELSSLATDQQLYALAFLCRANRLAQLLPNGQAYPNAWSYAPATGQFAYQPQVFHWQPANGEYTDYALYWLAYQAGNADSEASPETPEEAVSLDDIEEQLRKIQAMLEQLKGNNK